jgi:hypothetical protein
MLACLGAGCDGPQQHVLPGQLYEAARDCIDPTSSIDLVPGSDPGYGCSPTCVVTPAGVNGGAAGVYVTNECGPFPPLDDTSGTSPYCAPALAALARGDICAGDGTSSDPADAGLEGASADDAGGD